MMSKLIMAVIWPAFLAACLLEAAVFAFVDPLDLSWAGGSLGWSRQAVYTLGFFAFWGACIVSSLTALALACPSAGRDPAHAHE